MPGFALYKFESDLVAFSCRSCFFFIVATSPLAGRKITKSLKGPKDLFASPVVLAGEGNSLFYPAMPTDGRAVCVPTSFSAASGEQVFIVLCKATKTRHLWSAHGAVWFMSMFHEVCTFGQVYALSQHKGNVIIKYTKQIPSLEAEGLCLPLASRCTAVSQTGSASLCWPLCSCQCF